LVLGVCGLGLPNDTRLGGRIAFCPTEVGRELEEAGVLRPGALEPLSRLLDAYDRLPEGFRAVDAVEADVLGLEPVDVLQRRGGGLVAPSRVCGPLQVLLKRGRIVEDLQDFRLPDARGGEEGAAVKPEPTRSIGRAVVDDLVGDPLP